MSGLIDRAELMARRAHAGQVDKSGQPYAEHPARVAERVAGRARSDVREVAVAAAWLHDVVEDTPVTLVEVEEQFGPDVALLVDALTKRPAEGPGYYDRVKAAGQVAVLIKTADLDDNTDPARTSMLSDEDRDRLAAKYATARSALTEV